MPKAAAAQTSGNRQSLLPAGTLLPYVGEGAPAGFLLCYGQTVNKTDYPALAALCGTKFGAGSATTFVLPDLRGRVVAGMDDMGGSSANRLVNAVDGDVLGGAGGGEDIAITTAADLTTGGATSYVTAITTGGGAVQPTIVLNYIIKT